MVGLIFGLYPCLEPNHFSNDRLRDAKTSGQFALRSDASSVGSPNFIGDGHCQFGVWLGGPSRKSFWVKSATTPVTGCVTSLRDHIGNVVGIGSEKQMVWSHARGNIASVADNHAGRDVTICEVPRKTRGTVTAAGRLTDVDCTVSQAIECAVPKPARLGFFDLRPKVIVYFGDLAADPTGTTTVTASSFGKPDGVLGESASAGMAGDGFGSAASGLLNTGTTTKSISPNAKSGRPSHEGCAALGAGSGNARLSVHRGNSFRYAMPRTVTAVRGFLTFTL